MWECFGGFFCFFSSTGVALCCPLERMQIEGHWPFQTHELCPSFILPKLANTGQLFKCWAECCLCARTLRMLRENLEEEVVIMKDVPGWKVRSKKKNQLLLLIHYFLVIYYFFHIQHLYDIIIEKNFSWPVQHYLIDAFSLVFNILDVFIFKTVQTPKKNHTINICISYKY